MVKLYGKNSIYEAIRSNKGKLEVFISEDQAQTNRKYIEMLEEKNIKYSIVTKKEHKERFGDNTQGFLAYRSDYTYKSLDILSKDDKNQIVLVLDKITDPHNFGAILRSCDAFNVKAVIISKNNSVSLNSTVSKVSTGAIEYVDVIMVNNLHQTLRKLKEMNYWVVGSDATGTSDVSQLDKNLNYAVIIGSEGFGMSKIVKTECDFIVSIKMHGNVNSLNASVSAGIILNSLRN